MKLFRPFFTALAIAVATLTIAVTASPTFAQEPIVDVVDQIEQSVFFGADELAYAFVALIVLAALISFAIQQRKDRREAAADDFDGGFYDAWRIPYREPPD